MDGDSVFHFSLTLKDQETEEGKEMESKRCKGEGEVARIEIAVKQQMRFWRNTERSYRLSRPTD